MPKGKSGSSLGELMRTHGLPFVGLWLGTWILGGCTIWAVLETGMLGGADAVSLMRSVPMLDQLIDLDGVDPTMGNIGLAVLLNEGLEIVRLPLCVALTPRFARLVAKAVVR